MLKISLLYSPQKLYQKSSLVGGFLSNLHMFQEIIRQNDFLLDEPRSRTFGSLYDKKFTQYYSGQIGGLVLGGQQGGVMKLICRKLCLYWLWLNTLISTRSFVIKLILWKSWFSFYLDCCRCFWSHVTKIPCFLFLILHLILVSQQQSWHSA